MPRINADTVAEHRRAQERALLDAAKDIVLTDGLSGLTFSALAQRTDLARSSVYEYFGNKEELLLALLNDELPVWKEELERAISRDSSPLDRVEAYVQTQLQLVAAGRHELGFTLMRGPVSEDTRMRIEYRHRELLDLLLPPLRDLGVKPPEIALGLVAGVLRTAIEHIRGGTSSQLVIRSSTEFVKGGVKALMTNGR